MLIHMLCMNVWTCYINTVNMDMCILLKLHPRQSFQSHASLVAPLLNYIQRTWIYSNVWPPKSWSQFQKCLRTNNDCEGWHRRLNYKIHRHNLPFYQLIAILHSEAELVETQTQFLADDKLWRIQSKKSKIVCTKERYWNYGISLWLKISHQKICSEKSEIYTHLELNYNVFS